MESAWLKFQGYAAELFAKLMASLPGSDLFKLLILSALLGILLIWLYRFVSFQKKLAVLKGRIATVALEPFIFSDSARISILTPLKLIGLAGKYMLLSLPPLLILALPVIWFLGLLNQVIGYERISPGQQMLVSISAESSKDVRQLQVSIDGTGYEATSLVRSFHEAKAWFGINSTGSDKGEAALNIKVGDFSTRIPLYGQPLIPVITTGFLGRLLFPGSQTELPKGLKELSVDYPPRYFEIFGVTMPWVIVFLIISMISGLIFAKVFHIQI